MQYKDALKYGFFELQSSRDWYREVTADVGMHADLTVWWIRVAALMVAPIAPHFAEHVWSTILKEPKSVQLAQWPEPSTPVDQSILDSAVYMRGTIKTMRDAELSLLKKMGKGKQGQATYDPKKPRAVRIYVTTAFPEWQEQCVQVVKEAYSAEHDKVDDQKARELLTARGLIKDKRAMPFVQAFKVSPQRTHDIAWILTRNSLETDIAVRCADRVQPFSSVLGGQGVARDPAVPQAHAEPRGRRGASGGRREAKGPVHPHESPHRERGAWQPGIRVLQRLMCTVLFLVCGVEYTTAVFNVH